MSGTTAASCGGRRAEAARGVGLAARVLMVCGLALSPRNAAMTSPARSATTAETP